MNRTELKARILTACRADAIPTGESGLWRVKKLTVHQPMTVPRAKGRFYTISPGNYTQLFRYTQATQHLLGELVMHDIPDELHTHLHFMLQARGRVLITGLGLGCCVRGALANPAVKSVTVIERDPDVLKLVWPHLPEDPRLTVVKADALEWAERNTDYFDTAWHDLWCDPDKGEGKLMTLHSRLVATLGDQCRRFGFWQMPGHVRRYIRRRTTRLL